METDASNLEYRLNPDLYGDGPKDMAYQFQKSHMRKAQITRELDSVAYALSYALDFHVDAPPSRPHTCNSIS